MHILVATDGSDRTEAAARFLHALLPPSSVERITVFTVRQPPGQVLGALGWDGFVPAEAWDEMEEEANRTAREALERAVVDLSGLAGRIETLARSGIPGEEIVRASREIGADLIVIASHGWGEPRAIIQGSVSERVLHHAVCPVLVVPPTAIRRTDASRHGARRRGLQDNPPGALKNKYSVVSAVDKK